MLPSSRSSSSPTRSPAACSTVKPPRANGSLRRATAFITAASTSGDNARGSGWSSLGNVGGDDQPPRRRLSPARGGDVFEQVAQAQHRRLCGRGRDGAPGTGGGALPAPATDVVPRQVALDARVLARLSIKLRAVAAGRNAGCLRAGSRRPRRVCRSARWRRIRCSARRARRGHSPRLAAALGRVRSNSLASASSVASSAGPVWLAWIMLRPKLLRSRCGAATTTSPHPNSGMSSPIRSPTSTP